MSGRAGPVSLTLTRGPVDLCLMAPLYPPLGERAADVIWTTEGVQLGEGFWHRAVQGIRLLRVCGPLSHRPGRLFCDAQSFSLNPLAQEHIVFSVLRYFLYYSF